jgi:tetratricopeptide (TPR) repeat protein
VDSIHSLKLQSVSRSQSQLEDYGVPCSLAAGQSCKAFSLHHEFLIFVGCISVSLITRLGNKHFAAQEYEQAIQLYTEAIRLDDKNHVYYSNRR